MFLLRPLVLSLVVAGCFTGTDLWAQTARYRVTFDSTWSAQTHPDDFPTNPHFSGLIGGTHSDAVSFWAPGASASPGIQRMAETGSKSPLQQEVRDAISDGTAENLLSGGGIGLSPGRSSLEFEVSRDYPLVSLVSMIAPSPDWFIGVHGLSLYQGGRFVSELVVELDPYDAGTDSGPRYRSSNQPSNPRETIHRLGGPFNPEESLGTFTFVRLDAPEEVLYTRGDVNADSATDVSDAVAMLSWLFLAADEPVCLKSADVNDDSALDLSDPVALLLHLFAGMSEPPAPFSTCGTDGTADDIGCAEYPPCA